MKNFSEIEKKVMRDMAEKCAGVEPGQKRGRWTHEDRVAIVYSVLCSLCSVEGEGKLTVID